MEQKNSTSFASAKYIFCFFTKNGDKENHFPLELWAIEQLQAIIMNFIVNLIFTY